eukprot:10256068-Lingulodinium_polyedra.AAC.1
MSEAGLSWSSAFSRSGAAGLLTWICCSYNCQALTDRRPLTPILHELRPDVLALQGTCTRAKPWPGVEGLGRSHQTTWTPCC